MEKELNRLNKLDNLQLLEVLNRLETDSLPKHLKDLIVAKIRSILNKQIGI
jgi:hypothetical protein